MKFKVLGGMWGEGYGVGDIIDLDFKAAQVRLSLGEIEAYEETKEQGIKNEFACPECDFIAKNEYGLKLHSKKHKSSTANLQ